MSEYNIQMNKYNALNAEYDQLYPATKIANVDGLDTALQNNDPRNWGLDLSKSLTDANDGTRNGFYAMTTGAANVPFDYGVLLVHNIGNPNYVHQELTHYSEGIKACRAGAWDDSISAIKWRPWEYVNPPMVIGVEYRTTERYLGKPVYAQLFSIGACAAGSSVNLYKRVGTLNTDKIVSYCGYAANCALPYFVRDATYNIMVAVQKVEGKFDLGIGLTTGTSVSFAESYVAVKYTKTTD